jgi:hypothetical protein
VKLRKSKDLGVLENKGLRRMCVKMKQQENRRKYIESFSISIL